MAAELALPAPMHADDVAWRRLALVVPAVLAAWLLVLWVLGVLLAREPVAPPPTPIDAMLIELPGEPVAPRAMPPPAARPPVAQPRPIARQPTPAPSVVPAPEPQAAQPIVAPTPPAPPAPAPAPPQAPAAVVHAGPTAARAIFNPLPRIPDELRERASTAEALARFDIRADGTVTVELVTPTPDPLLNRAVLETLRTWRFFPATENGRPVASSQEVRIRLEVH
jgi:protein TonB